MTVCLILMGMLQRVVELVREALALLVLLS